MNRPLGHQVLSLLAPACRITNESWTARSKRVADEPPSPAGLTSGWFTPRGISPTLANRDTISPIGIVRDVEVLCGKVKYPADFLVLGSSQDSFCPIIFGRPFLNTVNAKIDCEKDVVTIGLGDMSHEFNFSKFHRQPCDEELPSKDEIIGLASIAVPPNDPLEQ